MVFRVRVMRSLPTAGALGALPWLFFGGSSAYSSALFTSIFYTENRQDIGK